MNALELADHLEKYFDSEPYTSKVTTMLRQQKEQIDKLRELKIELMLEKQIYYEAMVLAGGFEAGVKSVTKVNHEFNSSPVKELTDEEILKMAADMFHYSEYRLVIEFAKAILRKAQEK